MQQIPSQVNSSSIPFNSLTYPYYNSNQTLPAFSALSSATNPHQIETMNPTLHTYYSQYNPQASASSTHSGNIQHSDFENNNK